VNALVRETAVPIVLASASAVRATLLKNAGVPCVIDPGAVDEDEIKRAMKAEGATADTVSETLAELKAMRVAPRHRGALVFGADQMLECNGVWFDKPDDRDHAAAHLAALSGRTHRLISSAVCVRDGARIWHHTAVASLTMRPLSRAFIDCYLDAAGAAVLRSVGAYQLEGLGAQLFSKIEGDYFTVLGLPLLPLLAFLRDNQVIAE
jgi:septum formation protein